MASKGKIYLEYKYPDQPWVVFDSTQVAAWAGEQEKRMLLEHPDAKHRRRVQK
jgi:hypothetical protein